MNSDDSASRLEAARILPQRAGGTLPLRRSSPLIDACDAMKRCASSDSDISSENSATAFSLLSAAYSAKLAISALLWTTMSSRRSCAPRDGEVEGLLLAEVLDRGDLVPPQVRRGERRRARDCRWPPRAGRAAGARGRASATCQLWLRGRPAAALISAHERVALGLDDAIPHRHGSVSRFELTARAAPRVITSSRPESLPTTGTRRANSSRPARSVMRTSRALTSVPS